MRRLVDFFGDPAGAAPRISGRRLTGVAIGGTPITPWTRGAA
ncbi:hypothetical protein [Streptosporangium sp. CA-115845]